MPSLFDAFKQYISDAKPGGLLNPEVPPGGPTELAKGLLGFTPVVGDAISGYDAIQSARQGDYLGAALNGVGLLPFVPAMGAAVKPTERLFHGSLGDLVGDLRNGTGSLGDGFYLTNRDAQAALYPRLHAMRKGIKNPDVRVTEMETSAKNILNLDEMGGIPVGGIDVEKLKKAGYEGVTVNNELLIFDPSKVSVKK